MTQEYVAEHLHLSYQRVQKYETGGNRISVGRLYELAKLFDVPISQFFMGCEGGELSPIGTGPREETIEVREAFVRIESKAIRSALSGLVKAVTKSQ